MAQPLPDVVYAFTVAIAIVAVVGMACCAVELIRSSLDDE